MTEHITRASENPRNNGQTPCFISYYVKSTDFLTFFLYLTCKIHSSQSFHHFWLGWQGTVTRSYIQHKVIYVHCYSVAWQPFNAVASELFSSRLPRGE